MRSVVVALTAGLVCALSGACHSSQSDPDAQQLARINKELALLTEQMGALSRRVERLESPDAHGTPLRAADGEAASAAPEAEAAGTKPVEMTVEINAAGALSLDGKPVAPAELRRALRISAQGQAPIALSVRAHVDAPPRAVARVVDLARQSGVTSIAIAP